MILPDQAEARKENNIIGGKLKGLKVLKNG